MKILPPLCWDSIFISSKCTSDFSSTSIRETFSQCHSTHERIGYNIVDRLYYSYIKPSKMFLKPIGAFVCSCIFALCIWCMSWPKRTFSSPAGFSWVFLFFKKPTLAGILLGILTFKPQYAIPLGIVALSKQNWRLIISSVLTFGFMCSLSKFLYGIPLRNRCMAWILCNF